jgi:hypothetical protein
LDQRWGTTLVGVCGIIFHSGLILVIVRIAPLWVIRYDKSTTVGTRGTRCGWIGRWPFRGPAISTLASQRFASVSRCWETNISPVCIHRTGTLGSICATCR